MRGGVLSMAPAAAAAAAAAAEEEDPAVEPTTFVCLRVPLAVSEQFQSNSNFIIELLFLE